MNHFLFMVLHKKANLPLLHCFIECIILITFILSTFECLYMPSLSHLSHNCHVFITFHLGLHIEWDGPTHPHAIMPKRSRMASKVSFTNAGLGTSCVSPMATQNLSYSKFACLLALAIAFCQLQQNQAIRSLKTYTFMATWFSCLGPFSRVNGRLGLLGSKVTL